MADDPRLEGGEGSISFKAPGYSADCFIQEKTGHYELDVDTRGALALLNDLHRGQDAVDRSGQRVRRACCIGSGVGQEVGGVAQHQKAVRKAGRHPKLLVVVFAQLDAERGAVVGTVMSGLLVGILLARTVAGLVAEIGGWRLVFVVAAVVMVLLAVTVRLMLPAVPPPDATPYPRLLRSVFTLVRTDALVRRRMVLGGVGFGCFTILWTAVSFLLAGPPYGYGSATIGLFGLAGLAGALAAIAAGRFADRGHGRRVVTIGLVLLLGSWGLLATGGFSLVGLLAGIVVLDLAQQMLQISHQSALYHRVPHARSRVTSAYLVAAFIGGGIASALTSLLYATVGWVGVCVLGAVVALLGMAVWGLELARPSPADPVQESPSSTTPVDQAPQR